jgi:hypothetical protein
MEKIGVDTQKFDTVEEERLFLIKKAFAYFINTAIKKILTENKDVLTEDKISYLEIDEAASIINRKYWNIRSNIIAPVLKDISSSNEVKIDLYKILSATEYATLLSNCIVYDDNDEKKSLLASRLLNGYLGFYIGVFLLYNWDNLSKYFPKAFDEIALNHKEKRGVADKIMNVMDEHVAIISYSSTSTNLPIFINSTWWRSFCINLDFYYDFKVRQIDLI